MSITAIIFLIVILAQVKSRSSDINKELITKAASELPYNPNISSRLMTEEQYDSFVEPQLLKGLKMNLLYMLDPGLTEG